MFAPIRRSRLVLLGAGFLVLVAVAALLILGGGESGWGHSDLPVVQIGAMSQEPVEGAPETFTGTTANGGQTPPDGGTAPSGSDPGSTNTTHPGLDSAGQTSTTTTVRETVTGGVRVQKGPGAGQGDGQGPGDGTGQQGQGGGPSSGGPGGKR